MLSSRIVLVVITFLSTVNLTRATNEAGGFWNYATHSFKDPLVYGPIIAAVGVSLADLDGEFSDYASDKKPLFGSIQSAKNYSDAVTFTVLPLYAGLTQYFSLQENGGGSAYQYFSFLTPAIATYLLNDMIKNRTGRLRPDNSNLESFPSSHTAIASAFSGVVNSNLSRIGSVQKKASWLPIVNEVVVMSVALARLEAKKHHLTDTLVGYAIGKYFANILHGFWQPKMKKEEVLQVGAFINHKSTGLNLRYQF